MKWMSRILCMLLALIMCFCVVGCDKDDEEGAETTASGVQGEQTEAGDQTPADMIVDLPEFNFEGREFTMMLRDNSARSGAKDEFYVGDEITEDFDVVDKAVFNREVTLEDRLGIEFVYTWVSVLAEQQTQYRQTAGLNEFDVCGIDVTLAPALITEGYCYNWADVEYIGLDKVWWGSRSGMAKDLTINDQLYMISGDASVLAQGKPLAVFFNKNSLPIYTEYEPTDLYALVNEGGWTIDFYLDLTKGITINSNGDQVFDENDFYGNDIYISTITQGYISAFNIDIIENADGYYAIGINKPATATAAEKLYELCFEGNRTYQANVTGGDKDKCAKFFLNNHALFTHGGFEWAPQYFTKMADDYGIIPYPKLNEAQENYGSMLSAVYTTFIAPKSTSDTEFLGAVMESLASESYFTTTPAYYDIVLKTRSTRDEESKAMLDLVHDSIDYNPGFVYGVDLANPHNIFNAILRPEDPSYGSYTTYWQRKGSQFQVALTKLLQFYGVQQ